MLISVTRTLGIGACEVSVTVPESDPPETWALKLTQRRLENASRLATRKLIVIGILLLQDKFLGSRWNMVLPQSEDFMQTEQF